MEIIANLFVRGWDSSKIETSKFFARTHRGETLSETRVMDLFRELFFEAEPIRRTAKAIFYEAQLSIDAGLN